VEAWRLSHLLRLHGHHPQTGELAAGLGVTEGEAADRRKLDLDQDD
jgi:hypothetical protein